MGWIHGLLTNGLNSFPTQNYFQKRTSKLWFQKSVFTLFYLFLFFIAFFQGRELLSAKPNVVSIPYPCTIVGDIHGQFYGLLEMFQIGGKCPEINYLFLGDYVDRGYHSVEAVSLILTLKVRYPQRITMFRGNHETVNTIDLIDFGLVQRICSSGTMGQVSLFFWLFSFIFTTPIAIKQFPRHNPLCLNESTSGKGIWKSGRSCFFDVCDDQALYWEIVLV